MNYRDGHLNGVLKPHLAISHENTAVTRTVQPGYAVIVNVIQLPEAAVLNPVAGALFRGVADGKKKCS